jgi:outer membrane receptor protein involved in Fe transport
MPRYGLRIPPTATHSTGSSSASARDTSVPLGGDDINSIRNAGLTLLDLALRYPHGRWEIGASVNNVFDRTTLIGTPYGYYPTAKRTVIGSLRYAW